MNKISKNNVFDKNRSYLKTFKVIISDMMSSSSGSEDADYRLQAPLRILKEITLKILIIGDYGVGM